MKKINVISKYSNVRLYEKKNGDWILRLPIKLCEKLNIKNEVNITIKNNCLVITPINNDKDSNIEV